jgi:predicted HTH domain antitoxin
MPVTIPDEVLKEARLTEREALVEIACRLFEAGRLDLAPAARLAALDRGRFEDELLDRGIPVYRYTAEHFAQDVKSLRDGER